MPKQPIKNEAFEALDLVLNVIKDHEEDLARLLAELGRTAEKLSRAEELSRNFDKVEERLSTIEHEISSLRKTPRMPETKDLDKSCEKLEVTEIVRDEKLSKFIEKVRRLQRKRTSLMREIEKLGDEAETEAHELEKEISMLREHAIALARARER